MFSVIREILDHIFLFGIYLFETLKDTRVKLCRKIFCDNFCIFTTLNFKLMWQYMPSLIWFNFSSNKLTLCSLIQITECQISMLYCIVNLLHGHKYMVCIQHPFNLWHCFQKVTQNLFNIQCGFNQQYFITMAIKNKYC